MPLKVYDDMVEHTLRIAVSPANSLFVGNRHSGELGVA